MLPSACLTVVALLLASVIPRGLAPAQEPRQSDEADIRLNARLVNLNVKVTDRGGRNLADLKREDFTVFEEGVAQEIAYFEPIVAPVNLLLLLDLSGSIGSKLDYVKRAAKKFIDSLNKDDRVAIATFTVRFRLASNFSSNRGELKDRIDRIEQASGDTAFYDATWSAFDFLRQLKQARKAIVILTDGVDSAHIKGEEGSDHPFEDLLRRAVEEDATVYPIYFDTEREVVGEGYTAAVFSQARRQLEALAEQTGGSYFFASRKEDLDGVYRRVAAELHSFYSLAYVSKDAQNDGRFRRVAVKVNRAGAVARTRRGYYANSESRE